MIKIIFIISILILTGCARDYNLNPWTTVLRYSIQGTK